MDALVDAGEVRAGVKAGAVAGGGEDGGEGRGGGAFAVGSGDEDAGDGGVRVAERGGEPAHVLEIELAARDAGLRGGEFGAERVEMRDGFGVGHDPHSKAEGYGTFVSEKSWGSGAIERMWREWGSREFVAGWFGSDRRIFVSFKLVGRKL